MFSLSCLFALSSAVVVLDGKRYRGKAIFDVLSGPSALNVDLKDLAWRDLVHIPLSFIEKATPEQFERLKSFDSAGAASAEFSKAMSKRIGKGEPATNALEPSIIEVDVESDEVIVATVASFEIMTSNHLGSGNWIASLEKEMKEVLKHKAPPKTEMEVIFKMKQARGYAIPYLMMDLPQIAEITRAFNIIVHGQTFFGADYRKKINRQYTLLTGKVPLTCKHEDRLIIAEWAMITMIFNRRSLPRSFSHFVIWLRGLPMDFAKSVKLNDVSKRVSLELSLKYLRAAKNLNPSLWDAMAKVASGRFLADPARDEFPLLNYWLHKHDDSSTQREALANIVRLELQFLASKEILEIESSSDCEFEPRRLEEILQDAESKKDVRIMLAALQEAHGSLNLHHDQVPHSSIMEREIETLLKSAFQKYRLPSPHF